MIKLHNFELSGNCYKVRLMLSLLGLKYELVPVDLLSGEHRTPHYLKLNPLGQVPVLRDGEVVIRDAQAILVYLTRHYGSEEWLPVEAEPMSKVVQWLSTAANEIQNSIAAARLHHLYNTRIDVERVTAKAYAILRIMDDHLAERQWLELERPTIADVACFPYIALAQDGKISLDAYPHVGAWIKRMKQLPHYVGMPGL